MPFSVLLPPATPPSDPLRTALAASLHRDHRPELADLIEEADLFFQADGLWVRPSASFESLDPAWLEPRLSEAVLHGGLPLRWVRVLASGASGREE